MEDGRDPECEKNGTDILMTVLEEFGKHEPRSVLVVWTDDSGDTSICYNSNLTQSLGFAVWIKEMIIRRLFS